MTNITTGLTAHVSPSTSMNTKCQILIIGCGLGGLAAAIAIRKVGHDVTEIENVSLDFPWHTMKSAVYTTL